MIVQKDHKNVPTVYRRDAGRIHFLQIINPTPAEDCYLQLFDKASRTGFLSDYSATVAGAILCTVDPDGLGHGLVSDNIDNTVENVVLASSNYDDTYTVTIVDDWNFYFTETFTDADTDAIFWLNEITLGTTEPKMTLLCRGVDADGYAGGFAENIDAFFENGIIGSFSTALVGTGAPTANCVATMVFEEK